MQGDDCLNTNDTWNRFRFETFWADEKTAEVDVREDKAYVNRLILHPAKQIFYKDEISRYELGNILKSRCFDEGRPDLPQLLELMGVGEYDVYKMCRATHGKMMQDKIWFRYEGEDLTWEDMKRWRK